MPLTVREAGGEDHVPPGKTRDGRDGERHGVEAQVGTFLVSGFGFLPRSWAILERPEIDRIDGLGRQALGEEQDLSIRIDRRLGHRDCGRHGIRPSGSLSQRRKKRIRL